jgi:hypothetical protein
LRAAFAGIGELTGRATGLRGQTNVQERTTSIRAGRISVDFADADAIGAERLERRTIGLRRAETQPEEEGHSQQNRRCALQNRRGPNEKRRGALSKKRRGPFVITGLW